MAWSKETLNRMCEEMLDLYYEEGLCGCKTVKAFVDLQHGHNCTAEERKQIAKYIKAHI